MISNTPSGYRVDFDKRAGKDLLRLDPPTARNILAKCNILQESPTEGPNVRHLYGNLYRLRVRDWRVIYDVEGQSVTVILVGHRRDVYQRLRDR